MAIRSTLAALLALLATGCATSAAERDVYLVGSYDSLERIQAAANACGYRRVSMGYSHGAPISVIIEIPEADDPNYSCLAQWFEEHPEAGYGRLPAPGS